MFKKKCSVSGAQLLWFNLDIWCVLNENVSEWNCKRKDGKSLLDKRRLQVQDHDQLPTIQIILDGPKIIYHHHPLPCPPIRPPSPTHPLKVTGASPIWHWARAAVHITNVSQGQHKRRSAGVLRENPCNHKDNSKVYIESPDKLGFKPGIILPTTATPPKGLVSS